jgi:flagellar biosynthesis anti-sigma factor FlgM
MTNPISQFGRIAQMDTPARALAAKGEARAKTTDTEAPAPVRAPASRTDELQLSDVARKAMQEPEFDRAKVEAIKTAIQEGKYPVDSRRIAENFVAIEKMIQG